MPLEWYFFESQIKHGSDTRPAQIGGAQQVASIPQPE
jgi:hypothetical protein